MSVKGVAGGGGAVSAGTQSQAGGSVVFSNQNGVTFGLSTSAGQPATLTATVNPGPAAGLGGAIAGTQTQTSGSINFSNSNSISFGMNASSVITASFGQSNQSLGAFALGNTTGQSSSSSLDARSLSISALGGISAGLSAGVLVLSGATGGGTGGVAVSAGTQSVSSGTLVFANSNSVTFGLSGSSQLTVSFGQSAQSLGLYGVGNTTGASSSSTVDARSLSFQGAGAVSVGMTGGSVVISAAAGAQSVQTIGVYGASQTTGASSSSTYDARSMSFQGAGIISIGQSGGSVQISAPSAVDFTQLSVGNSTGGNTAGNSGVVTGQLVLAGGSNITLSGSTNAGSMTLTINGGGGSGGGVNFGVSTMGNTAGSTGTVSTGNAVLVGSGPISLSQSSGTAGATVTINGPATSSLSGTGALSISTNGSTISMGVPQFSFYASSQTTAQSSSSSFSHGSLTLRGAGGVSVGFSGSEIVISGATGGGSGGGVALSAGTSSISAGTVVFSNSNNISFGLSGSTITGSITAQSAQSLGLYGVGNTTQNSSTTLDARTVSFDGLGALTVGFSNGSVQLSAPATSSLIGAGIVSLSSAGSTISISGPSQLSFLNVGSGDVTTLSQIGNGSIQVYPINKPFPFSASRGDFLIFNSISSSSNSSHAGAISAYLGLYTMSGSTLSLASSGSQSYQWTNTSNNSLGSVSGERRISVPINVNYTGGDIWAAVMSQTASTNANWFSASNLMIQPQLTGQLLGLIGEASNASKQLQPGMGVFSATSTAMPASMALSALSGAGSAGTGANVYLSPIQFCNLTA